MALGGWTITNGTAKKEHAQFFTTITRAAASEKLVFFFLAVFFIFSVFFGLVR